MALHYEQRNCLCGGWLEPSGRDVVIDVFSGVALGVIPEGLKQQRLF